MNGTPRQDWVDANGVSLRYALINGDGPTIVLVHEMGGSLDSWNGVLASLPADRAVLRYDLRGFGLSEKIRGPVTIDTMVEDLRQLLDTLGIAGPVVLVGCAVGAAIALAFAARHPGRSDRVMAMAPATGITPDRRYHAQRYIERLTDGGLRDLVDGGIARTFPEQFRTDPAAFRSARGRLLANDPDSYAAIYGMLTDLRLEDELSAIACPVTFVAGTLDTARPPDLVGRLVESVTDGRLIVLETGHVMAVLTPNLVGAAIVDFLQAPADAAHAGKLKAGCEKLD
jgi:pimeloyl-ACP methyl ester carboxylesterase